MPQLDDSPFGQLFEDEPEVLSREEADTWRDVYQGLVAMLERQLDDTRRFMERSPGAMKKYLHGQNIRILKEELAIFRERLTRWQARLDRR